MEKANLFLLFTIPLNHIDVPYMVTGSVAGTIYGEPRLTHDVDLVVKLSPDKIRDLHQAFPSEQFYCPPEEVMMIEASRPQRGHFNIIHDDTGFKADIYLAGQEDLHRWGLSNSCRLEIENELVWVAPIEYVIIRKLEFYREGGSEKHLRDIQGMLNASGERIHPEKLHQEIESRGLTKEWERILLFL